jgi:hypothetical protein
MIDAAIAAAGSNQIVTKGYAAQAYDIPAFSVIFPYHSDSGDTLTGYRGWAPASNAGVSSVTGILGINLAILPALTGSAPYTSLLGDVLLQGVVENPSWTLTKGMPYYVGTNGDLIPNTNYTQGADLNQVAPPCVNARFAGWSISATKLYFCPDWKADQQSNILGPASGTDNAIARFDGTTGKLIQDSGATLSDTGVINLPAGGGVTVDGVELAGATGPKGDKGDTGEAGGITNQIKMQGYNAGGSEIPAFSALHCPSPGETSQTKQAFSLCDSSSPTGWQGIIGINLAALAVPGGDPVLTAIPQDVVIEGIVTNSTWNLVVGHSYSFDNSGHIHISGYAYPRIIGYAITPTQLFLAPNGLADLPIGQSTIWTAKGQILAAWDANSAGTLAPGTNGQVLTIDPSQAQGMKWATPPTTMTPTAHATSHKSGGSDAVKLDELAAPTDITTLNATTALHGLCPKGDNSILHYLRGDLTWAALSAASIPSGLDMGLITTGVTTTGANLILNSGPDSATGWAYGAAGGATGGYTTDQKLMGDGSYYLTCNKTAGYTGNYIASPSFAELPYFEPGKPYTISAYVRSTVAATSFRVYISGLIELNISVSDVVGKAITQPAAAPTLALTTGGSLSAAAHRVCVTAVNENGETVASNYAEVTNDATNNAISMSWSAVDGATGYNVYISLQDANPRGIGGRLVNSTPIVGTTYTIVSDPGLRGPPQISTAEWKRLTGYGFAPTTSSPKGSDEKIYVYPTGAFNGTFNVACVKFETGKLATAWIPNPKDKFVQLTDTRLTDARTPLPIAFGGNTSDSLSVGQVVKSITPTTAGTLTWAIASPTAGILTSLIGVVKTTSPLSVQISRVVDIPTTAIAVGMPVWLATGGALSATSTGDVPKLLGYVTDTTHLMLV